MIRRLLADLLSRYELWRADRFARKQAWLSPLLSWDKKRETFLRDDGVGNVEIVTLRQAHELIRDAVSACTYNNEAAANSGTYSLPPSVLIPMSLWLDKYPRAECNATRCTLLGWHSPCHFQTALSAKRDRERKR